ncbi:MAG: AmmeMemoRadiSam system protein A [Clostridia bacterium]|jgi:AmmeMemoRadiSam system protein A|nr:AmmeMemoRadiSam system protein A [Clostridia bacterium]
MGELLLTAVVPHPPIMVEEVGKGETVKVKATREAMKQVAGELAGLKPDTVVIITPHGGVFADAVTMPAQKVFQGNLGRFGAPQVALEYARDEDLAELLYQACLDKDVPIANLDQSIARRFNVDPKLDHGIVAPMSFFYQLEPKPRLLPVNMGLLPREQLYLFGMALREAIEKSNGKVAVIASSDLSHRVTPGAPAGYSPRGGEFDLKLKELLESFDVPGILALPEELQEEAGECGYRPIVMMLGTLDGYEVDSQVLSYEAPFGVGYLVARFKPGKPSSERQLLPKLKEQRQTKIQARLKAESGVVKLARKTLEAYFATGRLPEQPAVTLSPELPERAGAFVTLKQEGQLRGCIGTTGPTKWSLAEEIMANAVKAATEDPRFEPLAPEELAELTISVDVLGVPEPVSGMEELDPQKYGVIVRSGYRTGLLLPALEGVNTAEEQVAIARRKAGISPHEPVRLERFTVTRFT